MAAAYEFHVPGMIVFLYRLNLIYILSLSIQGRRTTGHGAYKTARWCANSAQ